MTDSEPFDCRGFEDFFHSRAGRQFRVPTESEATYYLALRAW